MLFDLIYRQTINFYYSVSPDLELRSKYSMDIQADEKHQKYNAILTSVRLFNEAVFLLRKYKGKTFLNSGFDQFDEFSSSLRSQSQEILFKVIETLNEEAKKNYNIVRQSNDRYYSGDFRYPDQPKGTSRLNEVYLKNIGFIIGYAYYCIGVLNKGIDNIQAKGLFEQSCQVFKSNSIDHFIVQLVK